MSGNNPIQENFDSWLSNEIGRLISHGVNNFCDLVLQLPSVYPADVLKSLSFLAKKDEGNSKILNLLASAENAPPVEEKERESTLPPPHPLDFEWRFSLSAARDIAEEVKLLTPQNGRIAFVATPSIAAQIDSLNISQECTYIGRDAKDIQYLSGAKNISRWETADLGIEKPLNMAFDTVVMDPPWYDEYMLRFLWYSAQLCRIGGVALVSMPGLGTRPGINGELERYRRYWEQLGFIEEKVEPQRLPYVMPRFEKNSLNAAGIRNISQTWRRGDLIRLRKKNAPEAAWLGNLYLQSWEEFSFGKVRIRVNTLAEEIDSRPELISIVADHVLPTVSRRDERRSQARVWTSGNRIFGCNSPKLLAKYLRTSSAKHFSKNWDNTLKNLSQLSLNDNFDKQSLTSQIDSLVSLELLEICNEA